MDIVAQWPLMKLANLLIDIQPGFAQRPGGENANVAQLRTNNVSPNGTLDLSDIIYVFVRENDYDKYRVKKGDVVFNNTNSVEWVGKTAYFNEEGTYVLSNHMTRLRVNTKLLDPQYLAAYLHYHWYIGKSRLLAKQWVSQAAVDQTTLSSILIPLPPLPEQRRIATILREAEEIRRLRKAANEKTQKIVEALFYDMFGDPETNPKGWRSATLKDVTWAIQDGPHVSPNYMDKGVPFLSTRNIRPGQVIWDDLKFISLEDAKKHWKKCKPEKGDILYTKGGTTGLAKVVDFDEDIAVWVHIALLKLKKDVLDPLWLENMLNSEYCYIQSQNLTHGITNRDLGLTRMTKIKLFLPPLDIQRQFASHSLLIQETAKGQKATQERLNLFYQSLLSRAFTGELTAAWREEHAEELAQAARERDALLQKQAMIVPETRAPVQQIQPAVDERREDLVYQLSSLQKALLDIFRSNTQYYFTSYQFYEEYEEELQKQKRNVSLDLVRRELHTLAALGLVREVALPVTDQPGRIDYITVYRYPQPEDESTGEDLEYLTVRSL